MIKESPYQPNGRIQVIHHDELHWRRFLLHEWVQLPSAIFLCVLVPLVLREHTVLIGDISEHARYTSYSSALAIVIAHFILSKIRDFPGVQSGSRILFVVSTAFATVLIAILVFRLDYSRSLLAASYTLSVLWFVAIHLLSRRFRKRNIALVPVGNLDELAQFEAVNCSYLRHPGEPLAHYSSVVADLRSNLPEEWERFLADCTLAGIPVYHVKQVYESFTGRVQIEHLTENNFGSLLPSNGYLKVKYTVDWLIALLAFPFFILLYAIIAPIILWTSKGPVFYRQSRMGYRGRYFKVWKFRTMFHDAAGKDQTSEREAFVTTDGDTRITPVGRILRRYRIDELPQILNILTGEMSWIGPRPEAARLSQWYEAELPFYRYRHVVRPGISGWAQISQGHVSDPREVLDKLHFDFFYIKYLSPWLDFLIVLRTIRTISTGFGSK